MSLALTAYYGHADPFGASSRHITCNVQTYMQLARAGDAISHGPIEGMFLAISRAQRMDVMIYMNSVLFLHHMRCMSGQAAEPADAVDTM